MYPKRSVADLQCYYSIETYSRTIALCIEWREFVAILVLFIVDRKYYYNKRTNSPIRTIFFLSGTGMFELARMHCSIKQCYIKREIRHRTFRISEFEFPNLIIAHLKIHFFIEKHVTNVRLEENVINMRLKKNGHVS